MTLRPAAHRLAGTATVVLAAALLTGCGTAPGSSSDLGAEPVANAEYLSLCVDEQEQRVDDDLCDPEDDDYAGPGSGFLLWYLLAGRAVPALGANVTAHGAVPTLPAGAALVGAAESHSSSKHRPAAKLPKQTKPKTKPKTSWGSSSGSTSRKSTSSGSSSRRR